MDKHQVLTLIMIFCYAFSQENIILWETPPSSWLRQTQTPTARQYMGLGDSYGRIGRRIVGPEGERNSTGRLTEWTNLDHQRLNHHWKNIDWLNLVDFHTYVVDVQLGLHVGPKQLEQKLSQKLFSVCGICSSSWIALSAFRRRGRA